MFPFQEQYRFIYDVLRDACVCGVKMITSSELVSGLLGVTGDEPEVADQRANEFEVTVTCLQRAQSRTKLPWKKQTLCRRTENIMSF